MDGAALRKTGGDHEDRFLHLAKGMSCVDLVNLSAERPALAARPLSVWWWVWSDASLRDSARSVSSFA
jgi:hypothetical protein